jgi:retinol dehydrogenase-14
MRNILITGGTDGMGRAVAERLAADEGHTSSILIIGRNMERGREVEAVLRNKNTGVEFIQCDLSTIEGMDCAACEVRKRFDRLDILVHAAGGVFSGSRKLTADGLEMSFAVQVLARKVLTEALMPLLRQSEDARVMGIAAGRVYDGVVDLSDMQGERSHSYFGSIGKQARENNYLFAALAKRYKGVHFINYGSGTVRTKMTMPNAIAWMFTMTVGRLFSRSVDDVADEMVELLNGKEVSGVFYGKGLKRHHPKVEVHPSIADPFWKSLSNTEKQHARR